MHKWREFASREALDGELADAVALQLSAAVDERGAASLVVSGGSTPKGFFAALSKAALPWSSITVLLADERWVAADHDDSNERMLREALLVGAAAEARMLSLLTADEDPSIGEAEISERLAALGSFDVVILGMGSDGHTASLFPGSTALAAGLDLSNTAPCIAVEPPVAPHRRMSMTLTRLFDSRHLIVHITGAEKREVLETAISDDDAMALPIAAVMRSEVPEPVVYWAP